MPRPHKQNKLIVRNLSLKYSELGMIWALTCLLPPFPEESHPCAYYRMLAVMWWVFANLKCGLEKVLQRLEKLNLCKPFSKFSPFLLSLRCDIGGTTWSIKTPRNLPARLFFVLTYSLRVVTFSTIHTLHFTYMYLYLLQIFSACHLHFNCLCSFNYT